MLIEKVYFNSVDNLNLIGLLHIPKEKSNTVVISIHGITSNCLKRRDDILAKKCTEIGISYFSFNNRGHDVICTYDKITDSDMHFINSIHFKDFSSKSLIPLAVLGTLGINPIFS